MKQLAVPSEIQLHLCFPLMFLWLLIFPERVEISVRVTQFSSPHPLSNTNIQTPWRIRAISAEENPCTILVVGMGTYVI